MCGTPHGRVFEACRDVQPFEDNGAAEVLLCDGPVDHGAGLIIRRSSRLDLPTTILGQRIDIGERAGRARQEELALAVTPFPQVEYRG